MVSLILICIFLMINHIRYIFMFLFVIHIFFSEMCVEIFYTLFIGLFVFLLLSMGRPFMFWIQYLCQKYALQIFAIIPWVV